MLTGESVIGRHASPMAPLDELRNATIRVRFG
jgi:hypothetical protein